MTRFLKAFFLYCSRINHYVQPRQSQLSADLAATKISYSSFCLGLKGTHVSPAFDCRFASYFSFNYATIPRSIDFLWECLHHQRRQVLQRSLKSENPPEIFCFHDPHPLQFVLIKSVTVAAGQRSPLHHQRIILYSMLASLQKKLIVDPGS